MFEKQEAKQKPFIQHQHHTREVDEGFLMCVNGFNSLGSPKIFHGLRYRGWMLEVRESYKFYIQRMKEDCPDHPDPALSQEQNNLLGQAYYKYATDCGHFPKSYSVEGFVWKTH